MKYAWSINEEEYHGSEGSREDAIQAAIEDNDLEPGQKVWTGVVVKEPASYYLKSARHLIEDMQERAYDDAAEYAENWLTKVTPEQESELELSLHAAINEWAEKHGHQPQFYTVTDTVEHDVTPADVQALAEAQ